MPPTSTATTQRDEASRILDRGFWFVLLLGVACIALVVVSMAGSLLAPGPTKHAAGAAGGAAAAGSTGPSATAPVEAAAYLTPATVAPMLELTDQDARPFSLAALRGGPVFVFFGYTHCTDVCPATVGIVGQAMVTAGPGVRAVFVTVDPARDTSAWLRQYVRYLAPGFIGVTGTDGQIARAAAAWGVTYAREETGVGGDYSMAHTADVYLVDGSGSLRARFPFGTGADVMTAVLRSVLATPAAPAMRALAATPAAPAAPATPLAPPEIPMGVEVVSSSIWSGSPGPIILTVSLDGTRIDDPTLNLTVQLAPIDGAPFGPIVTATSVQPPGVDKVSYVATLGIDQPGAWRLVVSANRNGYAMRGSAIITAKDPGTTAAIGAPAPTAHTPTLADVGGIARAVTTDPAPDLRLSQRSTTDDLADHKPFVLIADSVRFKVSPACGRAVVMGRFLLDRWPAVDFIHLEPYRYTVVTDTAVLDGSLGAPSLTDPAAAWGIGGAPWGPLSMPWIFVVDGNGILRAKYQGVIGSDDIDVIVSLIAAGG